MSIKEDYEGCSMEYLLECAQEARNENRTDDAIDLLICAVEKLTTGVLQFAKGVKEYYG